MSSIGSALMRIGIATERSVVPLYYHRETGKLVVAGIDKTNGGAIILDERGHVGAMFKTKRDALASINHI